MTSDLSTLASRIARHAHRDQVDKAGQPYVGHLERVVGHLLRLFPDATPEEVAAAWLHDVVEDGLRGPLELRDAGVPDHVADIVLNLTRPSGAPYLPWISNMAHHAALPVVRVKLADVLDNSDPARLALIPEGASLSRRYAAARAVLETRLRAEEWEGTDG